MTAAGALVELLSALARRQHEHRSHTADRLTAVINAGQLPPDLTDLALYYLAKAQRDLGRNHDSRHNMARVVAGGGRRAPAARRGLAHLARLAGDFPTAFDTAQSLGWDGRQNRVLGDLWWIHGDMPRAASAYQAARTEAEQHAVAGEAATAQAMRAFALAFTHPEQADDELELAEQLLQGLHLRATTLTTRIAALIRDAGTTSDIDDRARLLRTEITDAGLATSQTMYDLELAVCFHHAAARNDTEVAAATDRLRALTSSSDFRHYTDIAHFMVNLPPPAGAASTARWLDGEPAVRTRWHALVAARRDRA